MFEVAGLLHLLNIPDDAISVRFARASGPGGQHVNRRESAVQLFFDTRSLPAAVRHRLQEQAPGRINNRGQLVLRADGCRSQRRNREELVARLQRLLNKAVQEPARRVQTVPDLTANERRLAAKHRRSEIKRLRRKLSQDDQRGPIG